MKRLLHYLKAHPVITVMAPLFKMLEATFELLVPLVVAQIIDTGIAGNNGPYLWKMGGLLIVLGVVGFAFSLTAQYFAAKSAVSAGMAMRSDLFAHINTFSYQEIDAIGTSTLINRMTNDVNQVQNGVNMFLRLFLRSPFVVLGAMVMAFTVDVKAALPFAVAIPALLAVIFVILLASMPLYRKVQKQLDRVLLTTRENLLGIRVVRAFARQEEEMDRFRRETDGLYRAQIFVGKISALLNPLTYVLINLGIIAVLWFGGRQVDAGDLTQGQVIALINYMSQILVELVKLANLIILLSRALASLSRVNAIFDTTPSIPETGEDVPAAADSAVPAVSFENVDFAYAGAGQEALHGVTFAAMPGETIGVIGGTGSGKSTLLKLLMRFWDVQGGQVKISGRDVRGINTLDLRKMEAYVTQETVLFHDSIANNIAIGKAGASREEIMEAAKKASIHDFIMTLPQGYDTEVGELGDTLSGGEKQRVAICRALINDPDLVLADEPTGNLDSKSGKIVIDALNRINREFGKTIVMVTHDPQMASNCRKIILLKDGVILETLERGEKSQEEFYQEIIGKMEEL